MSLNKNIISLIKRKKMKLAIAESCTGGMLSSAITSVSGSSKVFTMGLVTYSNQAKTSILKVPQKIIKIYERYVEEENEEDDMSKLLPSGGEVKPDQKMGYVSTVEDARKSLENIFKNNIEPNNPWTLTELLYTEMRDLSSV